MNTKSTTSSGMGCTSVLTLIFVVLKLLGLISWSWWWVLSPIWISVLIAVVLIVVYVVALLS